MVCPLLPCAATGLDTAALAKVQLQVRQRTLRAFVRRGLIDKGDRDEMLSWEHGGGFSLDASVCIPDTDRAGLERLLRYCARPPFALAHLHPLDTEHLVYHNPKPRSDSPRNLVLTPLELIDKIAALIPPPRAHRHRYYGVLAPNSPMRAAVTALAPMPVMPVLAPLQVVISATETDAPPRHAASHYLWAKLLARIYETLPLVCPNCHAPMRIIAFITEGSSVRKILHHLGEPTQSPSIARHAGHRCGSGVWLRSTLTTPNGIGWYNQNQSTNLISASPGDSNCSSRVGLCAGFGVWRFLGLRR